MSGASGSSTGVMASANKQGLATSVTALADDMISSTPKGSPSKVIARKLNFPFNLLLVVFR